jgi:hypothetical protein
VSYGRSSSSSLVEIPKEYKTDLWLPTISSFVSVVGGYVGFPTKVSIPNSFIKQSTIYVIFAHHFMVPEAYKTITTFCVWLKHVEVAIQPQVYNSS